MSTGKRAEAQVSKNAFTLNHFQTVQLNHVQTPLASICCGFFLCAVQRNKLYDD